MAKLVTKASQVLTNIRRFPAEVEADAGMKARLAYNRAWYAEPDGPGRWNLGPSKFIGYEGMTAEAYDPQTLNGRETERQLSQWYKQLHPSDPFFAEIDQTLRDYLARYSKAPSSLYRINISNEQYAQMMRRTDVDDNGTLTDLLIAVSRRLPQQERDRLRAAL